MMDQPTFADLEFEAKKRKARREMFLERAVSTIGINFPDFIGVK